MSFEALSRRFARLTTNLVLRNPRLWALLRRPLRFQFDRLAPHWDSLRTETAYVPYEAGLEQLGRAPRRALDLGTGTGGAALAIARRFPDTEIVGADLSEAMIEQARANLPEELSERVRFEVADASRLPYDDASFDLVGLSNMIPFFDELDRILMPGGWTIFAFSGGAETPIYVPPARLRQELSRRGFADFAEISTNPGTGFLARKGDGA